MEETQAVAKTCSDGNLMLDNTFHSKEPELLVELAEHTAQTVRQMIDVDPTVAPSQIGDTVANQMMLV